MADRPKEGYSDGSDDGGNKTLRGFVLIRKSHGEKNGSMFAEHSRFNCTVYYMSLHDVNMYMSICNELLKTIFKTHNHTGMRC